MNGLHGVNNEQWRESISSRQEIFNRRKSFEEFAPITFGAIESVGSVDQIPTVSQNCSQEQKKGWGKKLYTPMKLTCNDCGDAASRKSDKYAPSQIKKILQ